MDSSPSGRPLAAHNLHQCESPCVRLHCVTEGGVKGDWIVQHTLRDFPFSRSPRCVVRECASFGATINQGKKIQEEAVRTPMPQVAILPC